jgi:hypothetical protein
MARRRIKLRDRWRELVRRWRIPNTVVARARHRCEVRLPDVCTYWGKELHEITMPPQTTEDMVFVCPQCAAYLRANPEWAIEKGLKKSAT